jgi:hypothetical protein
MTMELTTGKRYFGTHDEGRIVLEAGDVVRWLSPFGLGDVKSTPRKDFEEWAGASQRRSYIHRDGSRRIKVREEDGFVDWVEIDRPNDVRRSTPEEWKKWRKNAT